MIGQPEALRLADAIGYSSIPLGVQAAAELRRLFQLAQDQHTEIYGLRLRVQNAERATGAAQDGLGYISTDPIPTSATEAHGDTSPGCPEL